MVNRLRDALAVTLFRAAHWIAGRHVYLSTGCLHGDHEYCNGNTGANGTKVPASCKFCAAPCQCACHQGHRK
ncbi:hypothetical protein [Streptomyces sp. NPDC051173]|uniref:hypothetical protein n=1 Tax=Streptomyces sp. NPDC051173 TaxID=3155164 RepID=UPI00344BCE58